MILYDGCGTACHTMAEAAGSQASGWGSGNQGSVEKHSCNNGLGALLYHAVPVGVFFPPVPLDGRIIEWGKNGHIV